MKNLNLSLLVTSVLVAACAVFSSPAGAQQAKIFNWQPANDETVRMDPGNYYTARTYNPGLEGGNLHVDIKSERPVTVFMTDAMSWDLALQHPDTIRNVRTSCLQEHVVESTYVWNLPGVAMTLVIRDERHSRREGEFGLGRAVRPDDRPDARDGDGDRARMGEGAEGRRFFEPNDIHIQYYSWDCVQNCIQPEFQWMRQVKEKYDLTSFLKVYSGFVADHDQTQVSIKVKAPVPMAVAMLPSNVANQLHAKPELLESALEKSSCQQRGVEKTGFQCTFNVSDGPQSLIVVPEDTSNIPGKKKSEIEMQFVKCVANCQLIETNQKSAAADTPNQN